jgi:hypothetical protein
VPNEIETETISVNGDEKEVDIKWRVWQFSDVFTGFNNKRIYSKNTAVLTKNTNNTCSLVPSTGYYFKDLIHGPLYSTGWAIGYGVSYTETSFSKTLNPCSLEMKIGFTVKVSLVCTGFPVEDESPQSGTKNVPVATLQ